MFWKKRKYSDFQAEIRSHLDHEADELKEEGANPREARQGAHREFGNVIAAEERFYEAHRLLWFEQFRQDLRYAARMLRRNPGFTAVAVLSLALGIGANTAVFSLVDALMLKSLSVRNPSELRILEWVWEGDAPLENHSGYRTVDPITKRPVSGSFSYAAYRTFRRNLPQFSDLMAYARQEFNVTANGASEIAYGQFVSGNYFTGLGAQPFIGRPILDDDDAAGRPRVAVLTYRYWEKRFALDPGIIGREIVINQRPVTVVGVMQPKFQGLYPGRSTDLFVPLALDAEIGPRWFSLTAPDAWWVQIFGRLRPGVSDRGAEAALQTTLAHVIQSYRNNAAAPPISLRPGARGVSLLRNSSSNTLSILGVVVSLVLLIACVNLANLLVARSTSRRREIAVRLSIGAGTGRLIRQLLTESLLLAGAGGVLGLLLAGPLLQALLPLVAGSQQLSPDTRIDLRALAFTACLTLAACLLFGTLPAWRSTRVSLAPALKEGTTGASGGQRLRLSRFLVSAQVALSLLLLVGALLFVRTLTNLAAVDLGFRPERLLTFDTDAGRSRYKGRQTSEVYQRLQAKIAAIPGVEAVALSEEGLMRGSESDAGVYVPGRSQAQDAGSLVLYCSASFLSTMRIPVLFGRDLAVADERAGENTAVVNQLFADRFFARGNPVGQVFYLGDGKPPAPGDKPIRIVGVAKNAHYIDVREHLSPVVYTPYTSQQNPAGMTFAIRTALPPLSIATAVRRAVAETDAAIPIADMKTEEQQINESIGKERLFAGLVSAFGAVAALLAAIGLYGVMAYSVARRTVEIGIRVALGARRGNLQWMVLRQSLWMIAFGLVIGIPAALALTGLVQKTLFGVKPTDPASFAAAAILMLAVGAVAAWLPARRASRVDPIRALRCE